MFFYCERAEGNVDRNECEYCQFVKKCRKDGYLSKIDSQLGLKSEYSEERGLQRLAKQLQRAQKFSHLAKSEEEAKKVQAKKAAYLWKQTGIIQATQPHQEPLTQNDLQKIAETLNVPVDSERLRELTKETKAYLVTKAIWESKPDSSANIKARLKTTKELAEKLANHLDQLDPEVYSALNSAYDDIDAFHLSIHRLHNTVGEMLENAFSKDAWVGGLANLPLMRYYNALARFYETTTRKKATVSYNWVKNKDKNSSLEPSQFLLFVHTCIECIDRQKVPSRVNT